MTLRSTSLHDTWEDAHATILRQREQDQKDAESKLPPSKRRLERRPRDAAEGAKGTNATIRSFTSPWRPS